MPMQIPRPRFSVRLLMVLVVFAALAVYSLMPILPGSVDLKEGTGPAVRAGDFIEVRFVARVGGTQLSDWLGLGSNTDISMGQGGPFTIYAGKGQSIRGFDRGVVGMKAGGFRKLVIPPADAYGELGVPPVIPPNSTLIFEVELLRILPKPRK